MTDALSGAAVAGLAAFALAVAVFVELATAFLGSPAPAQADKNKAAAQGTANMIIFFIVFILKGGEGYKKCACGVFE